MGSNPTRRTSGRYCSRRSLLTTDYMLHLADPHEREILFAPLTGIEVSSTKVVGATLVVNVSLSVNLTALTIEQATRPHAHRPWRPHRSHCALTALSLHACPQHCTHDRDTARMATTLHAWPQPNALGGVEAVQDAEGHGADNATGGAERAGR